MDLTAERIARQNSGERNALDNLPSYLLVLWLLGFVSGYTLLGMDPYSARDRGRRAHLQSSSQGRRAYLAIPSRSQIASAITSPNMESNMNSDTVAGKFDQVKGKSQAVCRRGRRQRQARQLRHRRPGKRRRQGSLGHTKDAARVRSRSAEATAQAKPPPAHRSHSPRRSRKDHLTAQNVKNTVNDKTDEIKHQHDSVTVLAAGFATL